MNDMSNYYDDGLVELTAQQQEQDDHQQDYSHSSCNLVVYQDGEGERGGRDNEENSSYSSGRSSYNGNDLDSDTASLTENSVSNTGTSISISSGSTSGSDNGTKYKKGSKDHEGKRKKWFDTLWSMVDRMDGERKSRRVCDNGKRSPQHPVKNILRPPTKYVYVMGMSGLPSKVAVYPKRK